MSQSAQRCEFSLVCPAYNEAENLPELIAEWDEALRRLGESYEMIVVDDGSKDDTAAVLCRVLARHAKLRGLRMSRRSGQSAALAAGFDAARGRWLVTSDSDLQNDPADLHRMVELTPHFDMVCGWRKDRKDSWTKRLTSRIANYRRRKLLDDDVHDSGCGLKLMRREITQRIVRFDGMHRFLPALAKIAGFSVAEIPVHHRPRIHGKSKYWLFNRFRKPIEDLRGVAWLRARRLHGAVQEIKPSTPTPALAGSLRVPS